MAKAIPSVPEEPDCFDNFDSLGAVIGYVNARCDLAATKRLLGQMVTEFSQEDLLRAGDELADMGLTKLAALVTEAANDARPVLAMCPYQDDMRHPEYAYLHNVQAWEAAQQRRQRMQAASHAVLNHRQQSPETMAEELKQSDLPPELSTEAAAVWDDRIG